MISSSRRAFLTGQAIAPLAARVSDACLARSGVDCQVCRDACETGALAFAPRAGGPAQPVIDPALCTACGDCGAICPASAILPGRATP